MLKRAATYEALREGFDWALPERLNMAAQVLAHPDDKLAILDLSHSEQGRSREEITYGDLRAMAGRLAAELLRKGVKRGDRVGVLFSQEAWCAAAHIAVWRIGAISVPLFKLFKRDALESRIGDSGLELVVTDAEGAGMVEGLAEALLPHELPEGDAPMADTAAEDP